MGKINYQQLSVLVADDFSSFRNTVNGMLRNLGVNDVHLASNGEEVIDRCELKSFDVILCDYDLGAGRNGQHVLEELRYRRSITRRNVFLMVSAEASRNIVMSAYDCEPDDYLMKPITGKMLQQRMTRLLLHRDVLSPVYGLLDRGDLEQAMDILVDLALADDRYSSSAQKMLGELYIKNSELNKAEKLYTRSLETRQLDWARLGLAKVKQLKGELDTAGTWLNKIVEDNPLFLPAYDVLADNWVRKGSSEEAQHTIESAVEVSPMSILRQKRLSEVAQENGDTSTAIEALGRTVKLGRLSCYGGPEDVFNFAKVVSSAVEKNQEVPANAVDDALKALQSAADQYDLTEEEIAQCQLLEGKVLYHGGNREEALRLIESADSVLHDQGSDIDSDVERVSLLFSLEKTAEAEVLLQELQEKYATDQDALVKLDQFLNEPVSDTNRELVATVNREGIDLYSDAKFDEALECFEKARKLFPNHIGIQLNIVQSYIGKLKIDPSDEWVANECHASLELVASLINDTHPQHDRFLRLKKKAVSVTR